MHDVTWHRGASPDQRICSRCGAQRKWARDLQCEPPVHTAEDCLEVVFQRLTALEQTMGLRGAA